MIDLLVDIDPPQSIPVTEVEWQDWFSRWGQALQISGSPIHAYELALKLTDDATIAQLNGTYRQQDQPTDVLSFATLETDFPEVEALLQSDPLYLGDIVISLPTAARQACTAQHSLRWELAWLAAHGLLHLLGWDHPDDEQLVKMLAKQTELLAAIGLSSSDKR